MARRLLNWRIFARCVAVGVAVAILIAIPARAEPNAQCTLATPVAEVRSVSELPPALLKLLVPIAEIGAPFNSTDAINDPTLPSRRLIRAGYRGTDWFVWYEHGGIAYFWKAVIARVLPNGESTVLANAGTVSDTLCSLTDGAFAGHVPPYPEGAWGSTDY
jgi:hypothetical protein